ncbi:MAG TPA: ABC transporter permease [Flavobacteriales bacterium]|nr:ABC transporter permease [Flavobacteriales bacterium]HPQ59403.1 ABC transporter permease [Flavobacteriales bacterium]
MGVRLLFGISTTLLLARLRQTIVAAVGVTFSITMFVALLGFMNGLNDLLDGLILNRTPHVRLYNEIQPSPVQPIQRDSLRADAHHFIRSIKPKSEPERIRNALGIMDALRDDPRVLGLAPKVVAQVFFNAGTIELNGQVNGIDVVEEERLFHFTDYLVEGELRDLAASNSSIVLGKGVADKMQVGLNDVVQVTTAAGDRTLLKVVGIYQSGLSDLDKVQCYASLKTTQKLLGRSSSYLTDIQVKLHDLELAPELAKEYAARFGCQAIDIQQANAQFETGSDVRNIISYAVGITLLIVAGFGIYNILNMLIYEKLDAIAILKATGFSGTDVKRIFIQLSLVIGVVGAAGGLLFGFLAQLGIDSLPFETEALPTIKTFPVDYAPKYYIIASVFALLTTYVAGLFPARKAARIDPVEIIRGK